MRFRSIPQSQWREALERLVREHRDWPATVDRGGRVKVRDAPLRSVEVGEDVELCFAQSVVRVDAPRALRIEETQDGTAEAFQLYDRTGDTVTLRFRLSERPAHG